MPKAPPEPPEPNGAARVTAPRLTGPESASEVAAYIGHMTRDLAALARSAKLGALAYLLEMTQVEANIAARKPE